MDMRYRCYEPKRKNYLHYGGRGITVCEEWLDPMNGFENFCQWALSNGFGEGLSLDREDNDKGYGPDNCRWTGRRIQNINKRPSAPNTSGYVGVRRHSSGIGWYGSVKVGNKDFYTGYSKNIEEAARMRDAYILSHGLENQLNGVI
jgi:hypothetical protein